MFSCIRSRKEKLRESRKAGVERVYGRAARVPAERLLGLKRVPSHGPAGNKKELGPEARAAWKLLVCGLPLPPQYNGGAFASGSRAWL